jgi:TatD DNase family protein
MAIQAGHFFSINPAMVRSLNGKDGIVQMSCERILTESDGPFVNIGSRTIETGDVQIVEDALGGMWGVSAMAVRSIVQENFQKLVAALGTRAIKWK